MTDLPYALGCPSCFFFVEVSEEDPDASLSELSNHIFSRHTNYSRDRANTLLTQAKELTEAEAAVR